MKPTISVLIPCIVQGPYLQETVVSALGQPECLEVVLVLADSGSGHSNPGWLQNLGGHEQRVRVLKQPTQEPADAHNLALRHARGTLISWLSPGDLYTPGALARAVACLKQNPQLLIVYGEGDWFDSSADLCQNYPTLPPEVGMEGFLSHHYICNPTVVFRRSLAVMLGGVDQHWCMAFKEDFLMRAFASFPKRIGYIPHRQTRTHQHAVSDNSHQSHLVALEFTELLYRHFGSASSKYLQDHALKLQLGKACLPDGLNQNDYLNSLIATAEPWLLPVEVTKFRSDWLLDPEEANVLIAAETAASEKKLDHQLPVQLLMALHPHLILDAAGPPAGPHRRLLNAVNKKAAIYPLLRPGRFRSAESSLLTPFRQRPFGVNLIGHALEVFGLGEFLRMVARALDAAGVPFCVIHHPAGNGAACTDRSLESLLCNDPSGGPYAFNLICMAAPIHGRWLLQNGLSPIYERYTIAAWPWETETWPTAWLPLLQVADELWPFSNFTASSMRTPARAAKLPLKVMPMAAEISAPERFFSPSSRHAARRQYQLPSGSVIFGFGFDLKSTTSRKNPMGALEAFQRAFPVEAEGLSHKVALMIKTFPPHRFCAEWCWLQARAQEDQRIHLVVDSLDRDALLALYGCCDAFVSLHRSEGFGMGIAEALQLGLHVIATDYGGNTDFCTGPLSHPVRWRKVPISNGAYPYADGHSWAEPDLDHAAEIMRKIALQAPSFHNQRVGLQYSNRFSFVTNGRRYRARLEELWGQRVQVMRRLRWRRATTEIIH